MSEFSERLKYVRKEKNYTQQKLADSIGVKQNTIATYEIGRNTPIDAVVTAICKELGCNEVWLRTGEGEPFQEESRHELIMRFASQTINGSDEFKKDFVAMLAKMDADDWKSLAKLFTKLSGETKKSDPSK